MTPRTQLRVAIIGAGMAGVLAAIKLREQNIDFVVYEKADSVGGTWRENSYPGLACDVPSVVYSYSFEANPEWSARYAPGPEIRQYFERTADRRGVTDHIRFGHEVVRCEWVGGRWHLVTSQGTSDVADVIIAATGVLHHPNIPTWPGVDRFRGSLFHSTRWDHDVVLPGRRVGVVGTGSTAVQLTSALVDLVGEFRLFQRTPQWVRQELNEAIPEEKKEAFRQDPDRMAALRTHLSARFRDLLLPAFLDVNSCEATQLQADCEAYLETVGDPALRERLRPRYRAGCKRLVLSADFYDKIQRPNAVLVTSEIAGVEPDGVRTIDGELHPLDVLVLATGFKTDRFIRPTRVIGRDGIDLDEVWAKGPIAYLSVAVASFPNLFFLNGPNGPVGNLSLIEVAEHQVAYVMQLIDSLFRGERKEIVVKEVAMRAFEAERVAAARDTVWASGCNSWYLDEAGVPATWTFSYDRFVREMAKPDFAAYE